LIDPEPAKSAANAAIRGGGARLDHGARITAATAGGCAG